MPSRTVAGKVRATEVTEYSSTVGDCAELNYIQLLDETTDGTITPKTAKELDKLVRRSPQSAFHSILQKQQAWEIIYCTRNGQYATSCARRNLSNYCW